MDLMKGFEILVVSMGAVFAILTALWGGIALITKLLKARDSNG